MRTVLTIALSLVSGVVLLSQPPVPASQVRAVLRAAEKLYGLPSGHETAGLEGETATTSTRITMSLAGDSARGVTLMEERGRIFLDTTPCKAQKILSFHTPYNKRNVGEVKCPNGKTFTRVEVEQK